MLFVTFQLDRHRFAIDASTIREVLPLVDVRPMPQAPPGIAGVFDFRGAPVPVIDLSLLVTGRASERCLSTRLLLVSYEDRTGASRSLGVVVEHATRTIRRQASDFFESGLANDAAPYLGRITRDGGELVQCLDVRQLLPSRVRDLLFAPQVEAEWPPISQAC